MRPPSSAKRAARAFAEGRIAYSFANLLNNATNERLVTGGLLGGTGTKKPNFVPKSATRTEAAEQRLKIAEEKAKAKETMQ